MTKNFSKEEKLGLLKILGFTHLDPDNVTIKDVQVGPLGEPLEVPPAQDAAPSTHPQHDPRRDTVAVTGASGKTPEQRKHALLAAVIFPAVLALGREVAAELHRANEKHGALFASPHEGYSVILEELDELWEHVKDNTSRTDEARAEAIQVAAMALKYALMIDLDRVRPPSIPRSTIFDK